jgi:nitroreductase
MNEMDSEYILGQLRWRYATKQFDANRKISPQDWATLEAALTLSPSSFGLQPWRFIVVTDPAMRKKLQPASHGQSQIVDASHLVVFTIKTDFGEEEVDAHLKCVSEIRHVSVESLAPLRERMVGGIVRGMDENTRRAWESRQAYIALGVLLTTAALLRIDACPMEGIVPAEYDAILGLEAQRLTALAVCTLGYRSENCKYASAPKVRFAMEDVMIYV